MANVLLKKSLELFRNDFELPEQSRKKKTSSCQQISTKKKGKKKELAHLKRKEEQDRIVKKRNKHTYVTKEKLKKIEDKQNKLSTNLKFIELMKDTETKRNMKPIVEQHKGRLSKNQPAKQKSKPERTMQSILFSRSFDKEKEKEYDLFADKDIL